MPRVDPKTKYYRERLAEQAIIEGYTPQRLYDIRDDDGKRIYPNLKAAEASIDTVFNKWLLHDTDWAPRCHQARMTGEYGVKEDLLILTRRRKRILESEDTGDSKNHAKNDAMVVYLTKSIIDARKTLYHFQTAIDPREYMKKVADGEFDESLDPATFKGKGLTA